MKKQLVFVALLCSVPYALARYIFTPLSVQWASNQRMLDDKAYAPYAVKKNEKDDRPFVVDLWGIGYTRAANCAYSNNGKCTTPLTTLIFAAPCFTLSSAFANSQMPLGSNPYVATATICPGIDFSETGALLRAQWRTLGHIKGHPVWGGVRAQIPFKTLKMARQYNGDDANREIGSKDNVARLVTEDVPVPGGGKVTITDSFAYRLDFLSRLVTNNSTLYPMVQYNEAPIRIGGQRATNAGGQTNVGSVNVVDRVSTTAPNLPYAAALPNVIGQPYVNADGTGVADNQRGQFSGATTYNTLATNPANQAQLWVVPTLDQGGNPANPYAMSASAVTIRNLVEKAIKEINGSALDYINSKGLSFATQQMTGPGDMTLQGYLDYDWNKYRVTAEGSFGVCIPTGTRVRNVYCLLAQPLGNNGHIELYPGAEVMWHACKWFGMSGDVAYHWVLNHSENVAAAFQGACVKNIGPCTKAKISWQYLLLHVNAILTEPVYQEAGVTFSYELYHKTLDHICFKCNSVNDFEGHAQQLNPYLLAYLTRVTAHKLLLEFFINKPQWSIFGGGDIVVGGTNIPKEIGAHLGCMVEF